MNPLPLWSHWGPKRLGPEMQVQLIKDEVPILPFVPWPETMSTVADWRELLYYARNARLPLVVEGTQWEECLADEDANRAHPVDPDDPEGITGRLSPYSPEENWERPAKLHFGTEGMRAMQSLYPNPPAVYFLSNNEARKLRWVQARHCVEHVERYPHPLPDEELRSHLSHQWIQRYGIMFRHAKGLLTEWREPARFVGYDIGERAVGRWHGWKEYTLATNERITPDWLIWDGGSFQCYTPPNEHNTDYTVQGCAAEIGNYLRQLDEAREINPDFYCDMSFWDGNTSWNPSMPLDPENAEGSKACQYAQLGQTWNDLRYEGWLQLMMWLLRPQSIREFRWWNDPVAPWQPYLERSIRCVERVHDSPVLSRFWKHGTLRYSQLCHPYNKHVSSLHAGFWPCQHASTNPTGGWSLRTPLPVWATTLEHQGEYLLYAHAPLGDEHDVRIEVPNLDGVDVPVVPREGAFWHVRPLAVDRIG